MGDWKDELKKLRSKLPSSRNEESGTLVENRALSRDDTEDTSWKKGVKPLKRHSETVRQRKPRRKKTSRKSNRRHTADNLPSKMAIKSAYGGKVSTSKQPIQPKNSVLSELPVFGDLPQVAITRTPEFKKPDIWVDAGAALQPQNGGNGRVLSVRIGVDFGTCYTKVTVRAADKVFFVDWDGLRKSDKRFLLPGELSRCSDGGIVLGRLEGAIETFSGLKNPFLSSRFSCNDAVAPSVAFIGWVFRYVRAWLYYHHAALIKNRRLAWEVNIGSPTDPWCSSGLNKKYRNVGLCAWSLSQSNDSISLDMARRLIEGSKPDVGEVGLDNFSIVPEFVAQVAGYTKSPQRRDGLHLLVDIGAGTVDIVSFNIYRQPGNREDHFPIFSGSVEPLGTHMLMAKRLSKLQGEKKDWVDVEGIPTVKKFADDFGVDSREIIASDTEFEGWVSRCVSKILCQTKKFRYPNAPEWKEGMRVFLTGGGSYCEVYRNAVTRCFKHMGSDALYTSFPVPENMRSLLGKDDFHRLSVAFGLTYDAESIGKIIRPKDVYDIPAVRHVRETPNRDELYPK